MKLDRYILLLILLILWQGLSLMGWWPKLRRIVNPLVELVRPIPPLAWGT